MPSFIANGLTTVTSADFTLVDGQTVSLNLTQTGISGPMTGECGASVQFKTTDGYVEAGLLTQLDPVLQVFGPGSYRIVKRVSTVAFGVDKS